MGEQKEEGGVSCIWELGWRYLLSIGIGLISETSAGGTSGQVEHG